MASLLRATNLTVHLGGTPVLNGVEAEIDPGTFVGLLGPNGSGKTTLLRTIAGLLPYRGSLLLYGEDVAMWHRRRLAQRLAFVRQFQALPFDFTVEQLVLLGRTPHKRWLAGYDEADLERVRAALAELDVSAYRQRSVQELSGGELQRVLLAQALVQEAEVLLLDEPTAHLDVHHQYSFLHAVRRHVEGNRTALAVFHDLELASRFADVLVVLHEGTVYAAGAPNEVLTPRLLADVFRMSAHVEHGSDGTMRISYLGPSAADAADPIISQPLP